MTKKERLEFEIDLICQRYDTECGECITRKATEEELNRAGRTEQTKTRTYLDKPHHWWKDTEDRLRGKKQ